MWLAERRVDDAAPGDALSDDQSTQPTREVDLTPNVPDRDPVARGEFADFCQTRVIGESRL